VRLPEGRRQAFSGVDGADNTRDDLVDGRAVNGLDETCRARFCPCLDIELRT
jgi:hypothetical protein